MSKILNSKRKEENSFSLLNFIRSETQDFDNYSLETLKHDKHYVIEGDNIYTLHHLEKSHKKSIDVIYIDPPYNTQKDHFKYSDKMFHGEWLSFMHERLLLSKKLLTSSGTIFISIGDREYAYLKLLCDEVFGEENFVANFIWKKSHTVKNDNKTISTQHEYILCFAKDKKHVLLNLEKVSDDYINKTYRYQDDKGKFRVVPLYKEKNKKSFSVTSPSGITWTRNWNFNEAGFQKLFENDLLYWGKKGSSCPTKKVYLKPSMLKPFGSVLDPTKIKYTGNGIKELKLLGFDSTDFIYPKPVELISHLLEISSKKDSIILDFFAGSGTTGQAVMQLNQKDGGHRKFILATNNENNICQGITLPRVLKAKEVYGFDGDIEFLQLKNKHNKIN